MQQLARGCALLLALVSIYCIYLHGNEFVRQTRHLYAPEHVQSTFGVSDFVLL